MSSDKKFHKTFEDAVEEVNNDEEFLESEEEKNSRQAIREQIEEFFFGEEFGMYLDSRIDQWHRNNIAPSPVGRPPMYHSEEEKKEAHAKAQARSRERKRSKLLKVSKEDTIKNFFTPGKSRGCSATRSAKSPKASRSPKRSQKPQKGRSRDPSQAKNRKR